MKPTAQSMKEEALQKFYSSATRLLAMETDPRFLMTVAPDFRNDVGAVMGDMVDAVHLVDLARQTL
jgi:hypothetical protein